MQFITHAQQAVSDYWRNIPKNTGKQMLFSFVTSAVVRTLTTDNIKVGLSAGVVAALATAIHAFITPLFLNVLSFKARLSWEEEMCRTSIALLGAGYIASAFGDRSMISNLFGLTVLYGLWNHIEPNRRDLDKAAWFGIMPDHFRI